MLHKVKMPNISEFQSMRQFSGPSIVMIYYSLTLWIFVGRLKGCPSKFWFVNFRISGQIGFGFVFFAKMLLFWSRQESTWGFQKTPTEIQVKYIHKSKAMFIFLRRAKRLFIVCILLDFQVMYAQWKPHASPFLLTRKKNWRISRPHQKSRNSKANNLEIQNLKFD